MARKNNYFKKLVEGNKKKSLTCMRDERTNEYYCYEKIQGVYERVSGPYRSLQECKDNCGAGNG